MAMVVSDEDVLPIKIPEALNSLRQLIFDVVRKNRTLVDYYIYPKDTPSEIEAYHPRLQVLFTRIETLSTIYVPNLRLLVDDAEALVSAFILPILDQLLNAVHGVQQIFITHYDRELEYRKPYQAIYEALEYRERQLKKFQTDQMRNPRRQLPESLTPMPPNSSEPSFCRFAVAFTNHRDHGKLSQVLSEDLTTEDRQKLRNAEGAYLCWDCPGCAFKLKYHIVNSMTSNIQQTDDLRSHVSVPEVEYRPAWLVKCHLYQPKSRDRKNSTLWEDGLGSVTDTRRGSTVRRQSDARRTSNPFFFGFPRRSRSEVEEYEYRSIARTSAKYGCPFCFITGREHGSMNYRTGRDLAEHVASRHGLDRPPSSLILEKYMVGMNGKCAENVGRWDLNLK